MNQILIVALLVGGIGLFIGVLLGIAQKAFYVDSDPREKEIRACLPGNNCGGCGYPGCDGLASAIVEGEAAVNSCPVGGNECAKKIAAIMGEDSEDALEHWVAYVHCTGTCEQAKKSFTYSGIMDCQMMTMIPNGGDKTCTEGCLGLGSCVKACPFGALSIVDGVAYVDKEKCKACGKCIKTCPKHLITLVPYEAHVHVGCASTKKGKAVMDACKSGCIGCTKCTRVCPNGSIQMSNNIPVINYNTCQDCGACKDACIRKTIQ